MTEIDVVQIINDNTQLFSTAPRFFSNIAVYHYPGYGLSDAFSLCQNAHIQLIYTQKTEILHSVFYYNPVIRFIPLILEFYHSDCIVNSKKFLFTKHYDTLLYIYEKDKVSMV